MVPEVRCHGDLWRSRYMSAGRTEVRERRLSETGNDGNQYGEWSVSADFQRWLNQAPKSSMP